MWYKIYVHWVNLYFFSMFKSFFLHFKTAYLLEFLQLGSDGGEKRKIFHHKNNLICIWYSLVWAGNLVQFGDVFVLCVLFGILQRGTTGSGTSSGTPMENSQNGKYCKIWSTLTEKKHLHKKIDHWRKEILKARKCCSWSFKWKYLISSLSWLNWF